MKRKSDDIDLIRRELYLEKELFKIEAQERFPRFLQYINPAYELRWFHKVIAQHCQRLLEGEFKRLMVFVPPQHGKSEIVSRNFPAWALGRNPDMKIIGASYSADLSQQFSRSIQRIIDQTEYSAIFPESFLNSKNVRTNAVGGGYIRNVDTFEMVEHKGFYKAVGVCGSLTGTPGDLAIIDDPVKDAIQAYSETYRERVWDWYVNVLLTRLHNDSKQVLIMTRWHEDDLAGRLLKKEPEKWNVVIIPAIREGNDSVPQDPRLPGEALWEGKHSLEKLLDMKSLSERTFTSLYQQRPTIEGGNIIKSDWFGHISFQEFNELRSKEPIVFFLDTAFTDSNKNDPSGIIATCRIGSKIYIIHGQKVLYKFPDLIRWIPKYAYQNGYNESSIIRIEPKANGISVVDQLRESTHLNVSRTPSPDESKETRLNAASPTVEGGRVVLVDGNWNDEFVFEVCGFPTRAHDEYVDLLCYAIDFHLNGSSSNVNLSGMFR